MADITMPKMGFDMTEGTIVRWLKKAGDQVKRGEEIAEIETDKVTIAIEAFDSGTISEIVVQEGQTVPVGTPIARLSGGEGDAAGAKETETATAATGAGEGGEARPMEQSAGAGGVARVTEQEPGVSAMGSSAGTARGDGTQAEEGTQANGVAPDVKASPLAKRMAAEAGVDLRKISGSGPGGRIVRDDIQAYLSSSGRPGDTPPAGKAPEGARVEPTPSAPAPQRPVPAPQQPAPAPQPAAPRAAEAPAAAAPGNVVPLSSMRRTISRRMVQSWQQFPHFFVSTEVDMGATMALRKQINEGQPKEAQVSVNDLIVKACAVALRAFPNINASYTEGGIEQHAQVNIAIAVALDEGLVAPVVTNCQDRSIGSIARESKRLVGLAREGKLGAENVQGGTFTVSNLGMYGVSDFIAIITPPQAAVLAVGGIQRVPVFKDDSDEIVARQMMKITISADHRVTDGAEAARFIAEVKRLLEAPLQLLVG